MFQIKYIGGLVFTQKQKNFFLFFIIIKQRYKAFLCFVFIITRTLYKSTNNKIKV